jgi:hypothetical protein
MNFRGIFIISVLLSFGLSAHAQDDMTQFDNFLCQNWAVQYYENEGEEFQPTSEHVNDLMIFYKDKTMKSIENMQIMSGTWDYNPASNNITIIYSENNRRVRIQVIELTAYDFVFEYKDTNQAGLRVHMKSK